MARGPQPIHEGLPQAYTPPLVELAMFDRVLRWVKSYLKSWSIITDDTQKAHCVWSSSEWY